MKNNHSADDFSVAERLRQPFTGSKKIFAQGSRDDLIVSMRAVEQTDTPLEHGIEKKPDIPLYDTSGPYTDPKVNIDLSQGLTAMRTPWITERRDTEELTGYS